MLLYKHFPFSKWKDNCGSSLLGDPGRWVSKKEEVSMGLRSLAQLMLLVSLFVFCTSPAWAQYSGGGSGGTSGSTTSPTYSSGGYGNGAAIGIGIGAAVAAVAVIYWATHHKTTLDGCVESSNGATTLMNAHHQSYLLEGADGDLSPGEHVSLKGKKAKDATGQRVFKVSKLAKNFGSCGTKSAANLTTGQGHP
jgi:hypothetical protein